jgi:hypothetical protein
MPAEFLTDDEAVAFGRYTGPPTRDELDRMFYLDDADLKLIARRRGGHMRLGFSLQLTTVRYLGTFLADPLDVPPLVTEHLAGQLGIADPSCVEPLGSAGPWPGPGRAARARAAPRRTGSGRGGRRSGLRR